MARIGGVITVTVGTDQLKARGQWSISGFFPKREGVAGADEVHGFTEMPQVPMVEGSISTPPGFQLESVQGVEDAQITLELANNTTFALFEAWETGEGAINSEEGSLPVKFEGLRGEQIR